MISTEKSGAEAVNYEGVALVELEIEGVDYRLDAGKQGTALCVSTRPHGTHDWEFLSEARWDGRDLRTRALERGVATQLSHALAQAIELLE
jgi:hypothetical protein